MRRLVVVVTVAVLAVVGACKREPGGGSGTGPSFSSVGTSSGVTASVRRLVVQLEPGARASVVSVLDTAVWAPFDDQGAAAPTPLDAGIPGPVARLADERFEELGWIRSGIFFDSAGVMHEVIAEADGPGPATRVEYRRSGRLMVVQEGRWTRSSQGWTRADAAVTYFPEAGYALRVEIATRDVTLARVTPGVDVLKRAASVMLGLVRPAPLAAQFYFGACTKEWLTWGGTAMLAEAAWGKFAHSRLPRDFKLAMAATATAGVALDKLVDCMLSQRETPKVE